MDTFNLIKIITTLITAVIALIIGLRVLSLNKGDILNVWFTIYFISSSFGFIFYTAYHLILNNADIIIPLMITAQIFFNLNSISLVMTVFSLEKYSQITMSLKYFGSMIILFFIMSIGYIFFPPHLEMEEYALGIVNTQTPPGLLIFVNSIRILLSIFSVYKYIVTTKNLEGETKKRMKWFSAGVIVLILGIVFNLAGGLISSIFIEIIALIIVDIGAFLILKGFLI
jgi:hypothetical protein